MKVRLLPLYVALVFVAGYASLFGFLSTDSWNYLAIARSLRQTGACNVGGEYFAVFPCGYPALIALLGWSADYPALIVGSKLANLVLWISAAHLFHAYARNWPATLIFAINPISLHIMLFTWSENMMLLAVAGTLFAVKQIADKPDAPLANTGLLALFLMLGCAARYFFGPFAAIVALAILPSYGRKVLARALPGFILAAAFFAAYQYYNILHTGFGTGVPRLPAPESSLVLARHFLEFAARQVVPFAVLFIAAAAIAALLARTNPVGWKPAPEGVLLASIGIGYLMLAFLLRFLFVFDPYGPRTVGPGVVLVAAGLACCVFRRGIADRWRAATLATAVVLACSLSATIGLKTVAAQAYHVLVQRDWPMPSVRAALAGYQVKHLPPDAVAVVSFGIAGFPPPMMMAPNPGLYYPSHVKLIEAPPIGAHARTASVAEFADRLGASGGRDGCYFDFTAFWKDDDLKKHLAGEYASGMAERFLAVARPNAFVPCAAFFDTGVPRP